MGSEIPNADSDWDYPLTDEDLRAIDFAFSSAGGSTSAPPPKRSSRSYTDEGFPTVDCPPKTRRRLPDSLFAFQKLQKNNSNSNSESFSLVPCYRNRFRYGGSSSSGSPYRDIKFGGRIRYGRTVEEVERAADELLHFVEANKRKEGQCVLGLDIEWKPTFRRGVAPGKAAVMQICGDNNCCFVLHIIHSQIPKNLQYLLEDPSSLKVGVCIANDAAKVLQDHNVPINNLGELSDLANQKLGGVPRKWSLSTLTETLICRKVPKPNKIRLGNWEVKVLSKEQLNYAATDAYVSWYLYQVLKNLPDPSDNKNEDTVVAPNDSA